MIAGLVTGVGFGLAMYWLRFGLKLTDVQASALLVLIAGIAVRVFAVDFSYGTVAACVSYALMSDQGILSSFMDYVSVGLLTGLALTLFSKTLTGIGGRLGTFAFVSVLVWLGVKRLFRTKKW
ncbi:MAG TPA: hypothetical protein GX739_01915 [Firmicutes bacterium]|nr:hypothetical protein [Bacillota bacterium]